MDATPHLVIAVDHPSLAGACERFLGDLRAECSFAGRGGAAGRTPSAELVDHLAGVRTMRLGVLVAGRLVAMAAVDNDGGVAVAVAKDHRRRGIAEELMAVVEERATAIGYPPLHRYAPAPVRLAG
jgi:GNAT superfamily N-acetyltransferase